MLFFPPLLLYRKSLGFLDCFTGQSPGIGRNELAISMPLAKSKPELLNEGLGGGWARGVGLASARSWLLGGSFPSTLVRSVQPWSRGLAAKACKAAGVNWAVHRLMRAAATECWTRRGACWAFARAKILTKLAASSLHLPPVSMPRTTRRHRWLRKSSGYVRSFLRRASVKAVPAYCPALRCGWPSLVWSETVVVSTASWAPLQIGRPFAITSMRRSSCLWMWSRFKSVSKVLVVTRAPASLPVPLLHSMLLKLYFPPAGAKRQTAMNISVINAQRYREIGSICFYRSFG